MAINISISSHSTPVVTLNKVNGNVVLIPLLYSAPLDTSSFTFEHPKTSKFSTSGAFKSVYYDKACYIGTKGASTGNKIDKSYVMIEKLLDLGWDVVVKPIVTSNDTSVGATTTKQYFASETALAAELKTQLTSAGSTETGGKLEEFKSRNLYDIKFISSGAYDNTTLGQEVYSLLAKVAEARGDCMALFELSSANTKPTVTGTGSSCAMTFWPACYFEYKQNGYDGTIELPAAFAYLSAFAKSTTSNPDYYAAAGAQRGVIPGLIKPKYDVGEKLMDELQAGSADAYRVNVIMPMLGYGYRTYGNRVSVSPIAPTASTGEDYLSFANIRILINDITKAVYKYTMGVMFSPNDDITWNEFTVNMDRVLSSMIAYRGIKNYRWTRIIDAPKGVIKAKLTIVPIEAVEEFDITFDLVDEDDFNTKFVDSTVESDTTVNGEV